MLHNWLDGAKDLELFYLYWIWLIPLVEDKCAARRWPNDAQLAALNESPEDPPRPLRGHFEEFSRLRPGDATVRLHELQDHLLLLEGLEAAAPHVGGFLPEGPIDRSGEVVRAAPGLALLSRTPAR